MRVYSPSSAGEEGGEEGRRGGGGGGVSEKTGLLGLAGGYLKHELFYAASESSLKASRRR